MNLNRAIRCFALYLIVTGLLSCASKSSAPVPEHGSVVDSATSAGGGYTTTRTGPLSDSIVHLAGGDSVEWQSFGPLTITGRPEGLLVTYHPFFALSDTEHVRRTALSFFDSLRTKFTNGEPPYIVLRAINLRAAQRDSGRRSSAYGVVLERRTDGLWYSLDDSIPIRQ